MVRPGKWLANRSNYRLAVQPQFTHHNVDIPKLNPTRNMKHRDQEIYLKAHLIREVERKLLALFSEGRIAGTIHTCIGQELTGVAISEFLSPDDWVVSNHRCHGHYLARFGDTRGLIAEILGKPSGICRGFGGSQHIFRKGFLSSGIQGGMTPTGVGLALAASWAGQSSIVVNFIGDGTLGQGVLYETMNLASVHQAPILYVVENNHYAQSTSQNQTLAGNVQKRAQAFDLNYYSGSTYHLETLMDAASDAIHYVRDERRPAVLEVETYRLAPHSKGDDFRDVAEIDQYLDKDLLAIFLRDHSGDVLIQSKLKECQQILDAEVSEILAEQDSIVIIDREPKVAQNEFLLVPKCTSQTQAKAINQELHRQFAKHDKLIMLGEDLCDPYGGAFKISQGLSTLYPARVINMPISEATIVGTGLGLALSGRTVITEIMFGDFIAIAFDQILNHASKFHSMYSNTIPIPLVIRTPMGGGRGYGSTHSQSLEKFLAAIPDVDLFLLHPRADVEKLYASVISSVDRLAILIENKLLYACTWQAPCPPNYELYSTNDLFPVSRLRTSGVSDVTVISFGGVGTEVEKVAALLVPEEINLDIFFPLHVSDFQVTPMLESICQTRRLLFVEEGTYGLGLSAQYFVEIMRRLPSAARADLQFRIVSSLGKPLSAAKYLEAQVLPSQKRIWEGVMDLYEQ